MALILVTGGAGFIGSNMCRSLALAGHRVVVSDRLRDGGKWRNLLDVGVHDIILPEATFDWLESHTDVAAIVHLGAVSATTERDVDRIVRENVRLSLDLWSWCARHGVRFIYASSAATYGDGSQGFADEERPEWLAALRPLNAYGWSKNLVDRRFVADQLAGEPTPTQWAGLKFFNVYGPGEDHKGDMRSVVAKIMPQVAAGEPVKLFRSYRPDYPDGGQRRDFVHVDDVVAAIEWCLAQPGITGLYNVGSGAARTWNDLAAAVFAAMGRSPAVEYIDMPVPLRAQYQYFTEAPMGKLCARGWNHVPVSIEEGVARYVRWWRERASAL